MNTEILHKKLVRYVNGVAMPAESKQIQNWLSLVDKTSQQISNADKEKIRNEILSEIQAYTAYPLFFPKPKLWWQKIMNLF
jgi:hypothetical protein